MAREKCHFFVTAAMIWPEQTACSKENSYGSTYQGLLMARGAQWSIYFHARHDLVEVRLYVGGLLRRSCSGSRAPGLLHLA